MKIIKDVLITLGIIGLFLLSINFYIIIGSSKSILDISNLKSNYEIGLILGCGVKSNGEPSKMLKDRLDKGIELYKNGYVTSLLVSGTHKEGYSEVVVMEDYLVKNGIPKEDILKDEMGDSTRESINNYKKTYKRKKVVIISQKYHLYRAIYLANKKEMRSIGVYAEEHYYHGQVFREIREVLARIKDFF